MTHLTDVVQGDELGGKATMNTKEATVDEGSDGERIEGIQACVVDGLRVLVEACGKKEDGRHIEFGGTLDLWARRCVHSRLKVKYSVKCRHSWLPRRRVISLGRWILSA